MVILVLTILAQVLVMIRSAAGNFTMEPVSVVQAEGLEAVFECLYPGATGHFWGINGTFPTDDEFPTDVIRTPPSGGSPAKLTIPAILVYNNTFVQCEAVIREGGDVVFVMSENATLQVQGSLQSVSNLTFAQSSPTAITISWTPPFSLNLTTAEPDIQYCVDVYNVNDTLVHSVCDINETTYIYITYSVGGIFNFTVTPRSNVEGSLNGTTSQPVQGYTCTEPMASAIKYEGTVIDSGLMMNVSYSTIRENEAENLCTVKNTNINFFSDDGKSLSCHTSPIPATNSDHESQIFFSNSSDCSVERHMLYNISVQMEYNGGNSTSDMISISTHDVQRPAVMTNISQPGQIEVNCTYLNNTKDLGLFVIIHSQGAHNFDYHAQARGQDTLSQLSISGLVNTEYCVLVYDFENSGVPRNNPAAMPMRITIQPGTNNTHQYLSAHNVTSSGGRIQIACSTECVGVIHSADINCTFDMKNSKLQVLRVQNGLKSIEMAEGEYHVAVFLSSGNNLTLDSRTSVLVSAPIPTTTTVTTDTSLSAELPESAGAIVGALFAVVVVVIAILAVIIVWFITKHKKPKKNDSLLDIENHVYSDAPTTASGPPMPSAQVTYGHGPQYENVQLTGHRTTVGDSPPSYQDVTTPQMPSPATGPSSIDLESDITEDEDKDQEDKPQHLQPSYQRQNTAESCGELEATSATRLCSTSSPKSVEYIQHGTASMSSLAGVEQPTEQPKLESSSEVSTNTSTTEPAYNNITQVVKVKPVAPLQQPPPQPQLEGFTPQEPAYDVVNKVLVKQATGTDLPTDETKTEHQYSEIQGTVSAEGGHYAHVNVKAKTQDGMEPSVDPTKVIYSKLDKKKLAPVSESETPQPQPVTKPPPPPPPTAETVLSEIHPIAKSWYELGEALGVPESTLDKIETEGSDQVRLHDMIQTYFSSEYYTHTWERIAEALHETGEIEAADRIVRTKSLNVCLPTPPGQADPPPLPPRNATPEGSNGETKHDSLQEDKDEPDDNDDKNEQYRGGVKFQPSLTQASDDNGESGRKTEIVKHAIADSYAPVTSLHKPKKFVRTESQVEYSGPITTSIPIHDLTEILDRNEDEYPLLSNQCTDCTPDTPYRTLMLHSLGVFENFDAPMNRKIRALGYMNSNYYHNAPNIEKLYQEKMSGKSSTDGSCAASLEVEDRRITQVTSSSNLCDESQGTGCRKAQKDMASYCGKGFQSVCLSSAVKDSTSETDVVPSMTALVTGVGLEVYVAAISSGMVEVVTGVGGKKAVIFNDVDQLVTAVVGENGASGVSASNGSSDVVPEDMGCSDTKEGNVFALEADKETAPNVEQGTHFSPFSSPPGTSRYKGCGQILKGVLLREHGCIFQPEDGGTCHLESAVASGELWLDSTGPNVKLLTLSIDHGLNVHSRLAKHPTIWIQFKECGGTLCIVTEPKSVRGTSMEKYYEVIQHGKVLMYSKAQTN